MEIFVTYITNVRLDAVVIAIQSATYDRDIAVGGEK